MTDQFRAMCAELVRRWDTAPCWPSPSQRHDLLDIADAMNRARALLALPTPQPPADGEVAELVEWLQSMRDLAGEHNPDEQRRYTRAAELLERPTPQPPAELAEMVKRLHEINNPTPQPVADGEAAELAAELRHFVAGYQQMRGLDPEHVYSIHRGDAMEAHLRISRLSRIAELLTQPVEQLHPTRQAHA